MLSRSSVSSARRPLGTTRPRTYTSGAVRLSRRSLPRCRAEIDIETIAAGAAALAGVAVGVGGMVWMETQTDRSNERENDQACFVCAGTGSIDCRYCEGNGVVRVDLGNGTVEESTCIYCDGRGSITCTNCNGSGLQPRFLDRREFVDDD